jgi:hypothetical protein
MVLQLRRRAGIVKSRRPATAIPPPTARNLSSGRLSAALVAAVVLTVRVEVTAVADVTLIGLVIVQVGASVAPLGLVVTEQLRVTLPVNPPAGVTEMVDVLLVVAPGVAMVIGPLLVRPMPAAALRTIGTLSGELLTLPCVAVTTAV